MNAAKEIIRLKLQMEADARIAVTSTFAAFEAHTHIVVGALLIVDDSAREIIVAHHVGERVQQSSIRGRENDPDVVREGKIRLAVVHSIKRGGVGAARGISRVCAEAIKRANIELDNRARSSAWNCAEVNTVSGWRHSRGVPSRAVDGPPDLSRRNSLGIARQD